MARARRLVVLLVVVAGVVALYRYRSARRRPWLLTGIVTTNDVIVSPQIAGQIAELLVQEGDAVKTRPAPRA